MCGIIGYIGGKNAAPILLNGLRRLEYRGYDSAGLATWGEGTLQIRKGVGRIDSLVRLVAAEPVTGTVGLSHTRWATHGGVTAANAHPHLGPDGELALVHNGVIENFQPLRDKLMALGHVFKSETDTEVLAHLVAHHYNDMRAGNGSGAPRKYLTEALKRALREVNGTYGIVLLHRDAPDLLLGARRGSPLALGVGTGENLIASDVSAMVAHTQKAVFLNDYDIALVTADAFEIESLTGAVSAYEISDVEFSEQDVERGAYAHYMHKEIHEQPHAVREAMRGRISHEEATAKLGGLNMTPKELLEVDRIVLTGCGTALHAAMVGEHLIESLAQLPCEVECASELRYRQIPITRNTLVFALSQSGETIDTLEAMRETKRRGYRSLGICNTVGSTIARESDGGVYMHAGPEIGVAATKTFTSQVTVLALVALLLGRIRCLSAADGRAVIAELERLPELIRQVLATEEHIKAVAAKYAHSAGMLFLGRQAQHPVALEGALKMKEISYIFASGHPSAELKHGIIALVGPEVPTVVLAPLDDVFEKNLNVIQQVKARKGPVIAIGTENSRELMEWADDFLPIPAGTRHLTPVLANIPLQLFAYHTALALKCDIDKPRNLAKSVTVE